MELIICKDKDAYCAHCGREVVKLISIKRDSEYIEYLPSNKDACLCVHCLAKIA